MQARLASSLLFLLSPIVLATGSSKGRTISSVPLDVPSYCTKYKDKVSCLYSPEPRCVWTVPAQQPSEGFCSCEFDDTCNAIPFCELYYNKTEAGCNAAVMPNGAHCKWFEPRGCACAEQLCMTQQPACFTKSSCEEDCDCVDGHCARVDRLWAVQKQKHL